MSKRPEDEPQSDVEVGMTTAERRRRRRRGAGLRVPSDNVPRRTTPPVAAPVPEDPSLAMSIAYTFTSDASQPMPHPADPASQTYPDPAASPAFSTLIEPPSAPVEQADFEMQTREMSAVDLESLGLSDVQARAATSPGMAPLVDDEARGVPDALIDDADSGYRPGVRPKTRPDSADELDVDIADVEESTPVAESELAAAPAPAMPQPAAAPDPAPEPTHKRERLRTVALTDEDLEEVREAVRAMDHASQSAPAGPAPLPGTTAPPPLAAAPLSGTSGQIPLAAAQAQAQTAPPRPPPTPPHGMATVPHTTQPPPIAARDTRSAADDMWGDDPSAAQDAPRHAPPQRAKTVPPTMPPGAELLQRTKTMPPTMPPGADLQRTKTIPPGSLTVDALQRTKTIPPGSVTLVPPQSQPASVPVPASSSRPVSIPPPVGEPGSRTDSPSEVRADPSSGVPMSDIQGAASGEVEVDVDADDDAEEVSAAATGEAGATGEAQRARTPSSPPPAAGAAVSPAQLAAAAAAPAGPHSGQHPIAAPTAPPPPPAAALHHQPKPPAPPSPPQPTKSAAVKPSGVPAGPRTMMDMRRPAKQWFVDVFDEDYLRTLPFLTPQATQAEAEFVADAMQLTPGAQVLDVGCGYGRHAMELAARGFHVVGLDLSTALLLRGGEEAQRRGLQINFVRGDMRELDFDSQFDGAYCLFSTFGYFDDETNKRTILNMARALKPGGRVLLEILNRDYVIADLPTRVWWEGDGCVVLEEVELNYFSSRIQVNRSVVFDDGRQVEQEISIRAYSLHEVGKIMHAAGFRVLEVSGGYQTRGRFFGNQSRHIIVLAERKDPPAP
ncbi:MAG TPA: methyltransferase domain-containing protein [Kofleriaceae bacterium]|nr:methyltransferase domain-containing protein [Kofleriaceae bacterium]